MLTFPSRLLKSLSPHLVESLARRREALDAQHAARRRKACRVRPRLEVLEDRLAPAAYTFTAQVNDNWSNGDNWVDQNGQNGVPGALDSATIPENKLCIVDQSESAGDVTVDGTLNINQNLTVAANNTLGRDLTGTLAVDGGASATVAKNITLNATNLTVAGTFTDNSTTDVSAATTVNTLGTMTIGSSDSSANSILETNTLTTLDDSTVTIGGPNAGSTGTLDTSGAVAIGGTFYIGAPGGGMGGTMDASSSTVTVAGSGVNLNVGGSGGSGGILEVYILNTSGGSSKYNLVINTNGVVEDYYSANLAGDTLIQGGVIDAENIDANTGADVTFSGDADIYAGPLTGNLNGEINAAFTVARTANVILDTGATLGGGTFYIDGLLTVNTALTVSEAEFYLQSDGMRTAGEIDGSGSIKWYNHEFAWQGGTIDGLAGGGFTIEGQADFVTSTQDAKTLSTTLTNLGPSTVDFDGTGTLFISSTGLLINDAPYSIPMELSLPLVGGTTPGLFENNGFLTIGGTSAITISAPLDNTINGVIDGETGAGPLTLSDASGTSTLDGSIDIKSPVTMSGIYAVTGDLTMDSGGGLTITGTLSIASGAGADLGDVVLTANQYGAGGTITGGGEFSTTGYFDWINGTVSVNTMTVGTASILYLMGSGEFTGNMSVEGVAEWENGSSNTFAGGDTVTVEDGAQFLFQNSLGGSITTFDNHGTLELDAGDVLTVNTFTQSSDGTLQCDLSSATSYGALNVTGAASLDGALDASLQNGYQPPSGTVFDVMNFASSSGQFATVNPQNWTAQYNPNSVDLVSS